MSEAIPLQYRADAALVLRAMAGGPEARAGQRLWAFVGFGVGAVVSALAFASAAVWGLDPAGMMLFLLGFALCVVVWWIVGAQRRRALSALLAEFAGREGEVRGVAAPGGLELRSGLVETRFGWDAVDEIYPVAGGTALRLGAAVIAVPDGGLPEGMAPEAFRTALAEWRIGARDG